jgi:flagellar hook-basal body complex protein FliE
MAALINPAAINAYAQAAKMGGVGGGAAAGATPGSTFGDMLSNVLGEASSTGRAAEAKASELVKGKGDIVDVVTAVNAAEMSLETVVAIRDRVISAYQDIMRMPI